MTTIPRTLLGLALSLALTACASAEARDLPRDGAGPPVDGPASGMCLEGAVDCVDTVFEPGVDVDGTLVAARALLGMSREMVESRPEVRIGRVGEEHLALTEDYVVGRLTVGLDDDGTGHLVVTDVTIELPAGPETVHD